MHYYFTVAKRQTTATFGRNGIDQADYSWTTLPL